MKIEQLSVSNLKALSAMAFALWPDQASLEEEYAYYQKLIGSEEEACLLARNNDEYMAFIHLSLRKEYVEGTSSTPVAYVEGIYVKPEYQRLGIGSQLLSIGEDWAKQKGCSEYASDTEIYNEVSINFHKQAGFSEINRIVCFAKKLLPS